MLYNSVDMKNWKISNREKLKNFLNENTNAQIYKTSDKYHDWIYLVKLQTKKEKHVSINENSNNISQLLNESEKEITHKIEKDLYLEKLNNEHNKKLIKQNNLINHDMYLEDLTKKIDFLIRKVTKMQENIVTNKITLKEIKLISIIKKELKELRKSSKKNNITTTNNKDHELSNLSN